MASVLERLVFQTFNLRSDLIDKYDFTVKWQNNGPIVRDFEKSILIFKNGFVNLEIVKFRLFSNNFFSPIYARISYFLLLSNVGSTTLKKGPLAPI